jgi:hypothetical protein
MANSGFEHGFDRLDHSFGRMIAVGYVVGFIVVFGLMMALLTLVVHGVSTEAAVFAAAAVAFQAGIMGAVIGIGPWSSHHEHELYH